MPDTRDVLAIIPVYHKPEQRDRCLAALASQSHATDTFVHDNSVENIGYTRACNRGLREALRRGCKFALVLNQDCYAEPDCVEKLVRFMDEHPRSAIAGPMQVKAEAPDEVLNAGGIKAYPFGSHRAGGKRSGGSFARSEIVPWVNGAALFVRMEAAVEFGLMDEAMFLIGSDSDWCLTARMRGWEVWYCADAIVQHEGGVSHAWPKEDVQRHFHNDMSYWRRKWVGTVMHRQLDRPMGEPTNPASAAAAMQQAVAHHTAGRIIDAEVIYRDTLASDPENVDAMNLLGVIELNHGMPRTAHDLFARAIALRPEIAQFHSHAAAALAMMDRKEEAAKEYVDAARLETTPRILEAIAAELARFGRSAEAAEARAKAQNLKPK